jgi:hypothetical protein
MVIHAFTTEVSGIATAMPAKAAERACSSA